MTTPQIAALLREREHYRRRNLLDRVDAVTAELERLGYETANPSDVPETTVWEPEDVLEDAALDVPETTALEAPPETSTPPKPRKRSPNAQ